MVNSRLNPSENRIPPRERRAGLKECFRKKTSQVYFPRLRHWETLRRNDFGPQGGSRADTLFRHFETRLKKRTWVETAIRDFAFRVDWNHARRKGDRQCRYRKGVGEGHRFGCDLEPLRWVKKVG